MGKRIFVLFFAGLLALSLGACKKGNNGNNNETTTTGNATGEIQTGSTGAAPAEPVKQSGTVADYSQYVTIGVYSGMDIAVDAAVVTDRQIQEYKDGLVEYFNEYMVEGEHLTEGTTKVGDVINLDFSGLLDGVPFDGGTATGQTYTIGGTPASKFIDDLDTQLAGLEVGKEYELLCTFPEDYSNNADLAGKEVVFVVTVNYIEGEKELYEWGDELVNIYTEGAYTTAAAYEEFFTAQLLATAQDNQQTEYENGIWTAVSENCEIKSYPEDKVAQITEEYIGYYTEYFTYNATMYGMDLASFLTAAYGMTEEDLKEECRSMAEQEVAYIMISCEIFKAMGKTLSDEEYNSRAAAAAAEYGFESAAAFVEEYGEDYIRESFIFDIVNEYLIENNKMVINE